MPTTPQLGAVVMRDGGPRFDALLFRRGVPQFAAFDLLWLDGRDLRPLPYFRRRAALRRVIRRPGSVLLVDCYSSARLFGAVSRMDLEGVVAKGRARSLRGADSQSAGRWELFLRRRG